jgi:hypothetical protein
VRTLPPGLECATAIEPRDPGSSHGLSVSAEYRATTTVGHRTQCVVAVQWLTTSAVGQADLALAASRAVERMATPVIDLAARAAEFCASLRRAAGAQVALAYLGRLAGAAVQLGSATIVYGTAVEVETGAGLRRAGTADVVHAGQLASACARVIAARQGTSTTVGQSTAVASLGIARGRNADVADIVLARETYLAVALVRAASKLASAAIRNGTAVVSLALASDGRASLAFVVRADTTVRAWSTIARGTGCAGVVHLSALRTELIAYLRLAGTGWARATEQPTAVVGQTAAYASGKVGALLLGADSAGVRYRIADLTRGTRAAVRRASATVRYTAAPPIARHRLALHTLVALAQGAGCASGAACDEILARIQGNSAGGCAATNARRGNAGMRVRVARLSLGARSAGNEMPTRVIHQAADCERGITGPRDTRTTSAAARTRRTAKR